MPSYIEGLNQNGAVVQNLRWQDFKALFQAKLLSLDYATATDSYTIYAQDGQTTYSCFLVFTSASANYPFPYPDGYTQAQNDTDVTDFTTNFQSTANVQTHFSYGSIGSPIPLAANLTGGADLTGNTQAVGITAPSTSATAAQRALVMALSPATPLPAGSNVIGAVTQSGAWTVAATQSGAWTTGRTWTLASGTDSVSAVQSGTWTVQQGTPPWTITGTGTAGTPAPGVVTIQGITGGFPIPISGSITATNPSVGINGAPFPTSSTQIGASDGTDLQQLLVESAAFWNLRVGLFAGATEATIKAASTPAASTDTSLVVALNPNTPLPAGANNIGSVNQGTSPWVTSVTGTVAVTQSTSPWVTQDKATGATGAAVPADAIQIGGPDATGNLTAPGVTDASTAATAAQTALVTAFSPNSPLPAGTNTVGAVAPVDGFKASYSASTHGLTVAATPTDIWTFQGSASKTIRITRISISGNASSGGNALFRVIKRSAADTGGTSATLTNVPNDSGDGAATAVVKTYTANPTALGAAVGDVADWTLYITGTGNTNQEPFQNTWGSMAGSKAIVLRGAAQFLCLNLNGTTMSGSALNITVEWTEE